MHTQPTAAPKDFRRKSPHAWEGDAMPEHFTPYESALRLRVGWGEARPAPGVSPESPGRRRTIRPDGTADWHALLVFEGRFLLDPDTESPVELSPGNVVLYPPHVRQDYMLAESDTHGRTFWAHFFLEGAMLELLDWPMNKCGYGVLRWDTGDALHALIADACARCDAYFRSDYIRRRSLALLALEEILRLLCQVNPHQRRDSLDDRVARGLNYISQNFQNPISLGEIASEVGLSPSRFSHVFSQNLRCSPMDYVEKLRIKLAVGLLTGTALPVAEIAERTGFSSSYYFSKRFQKIKGVSPTQCRKMEGNPPS